MLRKPWFLRTLTFGLVLELLAIVLLVAASTQAPDSAFVIPTLASLPTSVANAEVPDAAPPPLAPEVARVSDSNAPPVPEPPEMQAPPPAAPSQVETEAPPTAVPTLPHFPSPTPLAQAQPILPLVELPQEPLPNQIVITFAPGASQQAREAYIAQLGGEVTQSIDALDTVVIEVSPAVADEPLPETAVVVQSEPDYLVTAQIDVPPSDPLYPQQWALPAIGAPDAWLELPADAPQVTVAVIDSGICADHPDLQGRILPGWDFVEDDAEPQDAFGHGCGVAGIIAANVDDGIGMAGVAPNAMVLPLRVLDASGVGAYSDVAAAIVRATDEGAQVINLSLGGAYSSTVLENAINYAIDAAVTVVAAAGNTGSEQVLYPAAYEPVIAVGAVDEQLRPASFSAHGDGVDIWAPGQNVVTTQMSGDHAPASGTSFAAPYVAGAVVAERVAGREVTLGGELLRVGSGGEVGEPTQVAVEPTDTTVAEQPTLQSPAIPLAIIGPDDDRSRITTTDIFPWSGVVFVIFDNPTTPDIPKDGTRCSGTLIAANYVLTAAHCFNYLGILHDAVEVVAGQDGSIRPFGSRTVAASFIPTEWDGQSQTLFQGGSDYAVIRLNGSFTESGIGYFPIGYFSDGFISEGLFSVTGYPEDKCRNIVTNETTDCSDPLSWSGDTMWTHGGAVELSPDFPAFVLFRIDVEHGQSGSGLWRVNPYTGIQTVAGVLSWGDQCGPPGTICDPNVVPPYYNYATRLTPQIIQQLEDWNVTFQFVTDCTAQITINNEGSGRAEPTLSSTPGCVSRSTLFGTYHEYVAPQTITLNAIAEPGWHFSHWLGGPTGGATTTYLVLGPATITAVFVTDNGTPPPTATNTPQPGPDTTPPTASWISPTNGATISSPTYTLSANASDNPGGSGVREVRFSGLWGGGWHGIGEDTTAPYSIEWDLCNSLVPYGDVELGLEVWDNANNKWVYSDYNNNIHFNMAYACPGVQPTWLLEWSTAEHPPLEVDIHARVQWTSEFRSFRVCFDGQNCQETSATELYYTWNTYGWADGDHLITVQYRRESDNGNWGTALTFEQPYYLSPNRTGYGPCDGGDGAYLRSGSDCIRLMESQRDLAPIGWSGRSDLYISVTGDYEAWAYDGVDYQGAARIIHSGENKPVGSNVASVRLDPASSPPPPLPTDPFTCDGNTVALYHFDEGTGTFTANACSGANNGTFGSGVEWISGHFSNALHFVSPPDGRGVTAGTLDVCPMSVEFWVRRYGGGRVMGQLGAGGNTGENKWLIDMIGAQLSFQIWAGGGSQEIRSSVNISDTDWHLVMVTYDCAVNARMYLDNALVATGSSAGTWNSGATTLEIGSSEGIGRFQGDIDEVRISNTVRVPQPPAAPVAAFAAAPTSGIAPLQVQFTDQSTGSISSWLWNFGDGSTSTLQSPAHFYNAPGTYTVSLTASGPGGSNTVDVTGLINVTQPNDNERAALEALYNSTNGPSWTNKTNWITGADYCTWYGVSCDAGHVVSLDLINNNLNGTLPPELANLTQLQVLQLQVNSLTGNIPTWLGNMSSLIYVYLYQNQFTGAIPAELGNLSNLRWLILTSNQLSGAIPSSLGTLPQLRYLFLSNNQFSGSIPAELGNASQLITIEAANNQLSGAIPAEIGNLLSLESLWIGDNQLSGQIPATFGNLLNLQYLNLANNQLNGSIPVELGQLTNLRGILLSTNYLTGNIPSSLGNLTSLDYLWLGGNQLTGQIPSELGNLGQLGTLVIDSNALSGEIPASLSNLTNLSTLSVHYNALTATDPNVLSLLNTLNAGWETTQTIAPSGLQTSVVNSTSVQLGWTRIPYWWDGGYYEVKYATAAGGPYDNIGCVTADKYAETCVVTSLNPETTYYFVVRTFTPAHTPQKNDLTSEFGPELEVTTPSVANDTTPPTGSISFPVDGLAFNGTTIDIGANASDDTSGVNRVEFWANYEMGGVTDWRLIGTDTAAPYVYTWDWSLLADQSIELRIDVYDNAANSTSAAGGTVTVQLDRTPPTISVVQPAADSFLSTNTIQICATGTDNLSGITGFQFHVGYDADLTGAGATSVGSFPTPSGIFEDLAVSSTEVGAQAWDWHWLADDTDGSDGWCVDWDVSGIADQIVAVYALNGDHAGNGNGTGNYNITLDRTPPTSAVQPLPAESAYLVDLYWPGSDNLSGIASYDVQLSDNGAAWTDYTTGTPFTGSGLILVPGHTYAFRSRARDLAGNVEEWPALADASTTIVAPPANDEVSGAIVIGSLPYTNSQDAFPATYLYDPVLCPGVTAFNIVWYQYAPVTAQVVTVDTVGSEFDTLLGIFTDPPGDATRVACDNDSGGNLTSRVMFNAAAGTTYYIAAGKAADPKLTSPAQLVLNVTAESVDTIPPIITLLGDNPLELTVGTAYVEPGYTATDDVDGDITANVVVTGTVDTNTVGSYTRTYNVSDAAGNPATPVTRTVNVVAATASVDVTFTIAGGHATHTLPLEITLVDPATSAIVLQQNPTSTGDASSGHFSLSGITPSTYDLYVKGANTLREVQSVTLAAGSNAVTFTALRSGDANGDNVVSLADFSILALSFNKTEGMPGYDGRADFNGDNVVSLADFSKLALNFNTVGAQLPPP